MIEKNKGAQGVIGRGQIAGLQKFVTPGVKRFFLFATAICSFALSPNLFGQNILLSWDPSASSVAGYRVHYGNASGNYSSTTTVGNQTSTTISGLQSGLNYFFAVTAFDSAGMESLPSNEVNYQMPATTNLAPVVAMTSPTSGANYTAPATINLAANVTANGHAITSVQFYNGATLLGTDTSAPYSFAWSNVSAGNYSVSATVVYDSNSTLASTPVNVTVANPAPTIVLASPTSGANYVAPANIDLAANVAANGHTISKVQFYSGASLLGEDASSPYSFTWSNVSSGNYSLTARLVYDGSSTLNSSSASVSVTNQTAISGLTFSADQGTITPPFTVSNGAVSQPADTTLASGGRAVYNFTINTAGDYTVAFNVSAPSESANSLFVNIDGEPNDPYTIWQVPVTAGFQNQTLSWQGNGTWDNSEFAPKVFTLTAGTHQLVVRGREDSTAFTQITVVPVNIISNPPPTIALSAPANNSSYVAPAYIDLGANVTANGHTISKVQFYNGSSLLGEDATTPYNFTWSNVSAGNYSLTASVVYDSSSTLASTPINVSVTNPAPTVVLTSPGNGSSYTAPASINLGASVTANGHTISKVQFYSGATLLGEDTSAPYSFTWSNVAAGNYSLSASIVYDSGSTLASSSANVSVANPAPVIALTSPTNGTSLTAPASLNLAADVTANGHAITKVQFYTGTTFLGEDASAPYSFSWSNVSAGNYSVMARVVYDTGSTIDSTRASVDVTAAAGLPAPWQTMDIGNVGLAGSATASNGIYTVNGAGNVSGTADNFRFVYQTLSGDGEITARISSAQSTSASGAYGVMIRESLTSGSKCDFIGLSSDGKFRWQGRSKTGGSMSVYTGSNVTPPDLWVRIVRTGNKFSDWSSTDGVNWTRVNNNTFVMASNIQIGLVVASGNNTVLTSATFSNVSVTP